MADSSSSPDTSPAPDCDFQFHYGTSNNYIDVTQIITSQFYDQDSHLISIKNTNYNSVFTDPIPNTIKHLRVTCTDSNCKFQPVYIAENADFSINPLFDPDNTNTTNIHIVYFINTLTQKDFHFLLLAQFRDLLKTGLLESVYLKSLNIVTTSTNDQHEKIIKLITDLLGETVHNKIVNFLHHNTENQFEYPGLKYVHTLSSQVDPDDLILYFHSKGITQVKNPTAENSRFFAEVRVFNTVINRWKYHLWVLNQFPSINKTGASSGGIGWVWFNFWWARASYLSQCEEPIITTRRHYYEDWVARFVGPEPLPAASQERKYDEYKNIQKDDVFSMSVNFNTKLFNIGTRFEPHQASANV